MKELTPNGVFGDPTKSSAEKGLRISKCVTVALKQLVSDIYKLKGRQYIKA